MPLSDSGLALSELIDKYISLGFCILPLKAGTKHPSVDWVKYQSHLPDSEEINKWFGPNSKFTGLGTVTGLVSGIIVIDIDPRHGGIDSLKTLNLESHPATVLTGSGGRHYYFRYPTGQKRLSCFTGRLPGIDGRADGGFIVLPPTLHPDTGKPYQWINLDSIPEAPEHIVKLFLGDAGPKPSSPPVAEILAGVPESRRNDSAAKLAGRHFRLGAKPEEVLLLLEGWNARNSPPLPADELRSVVESVGKIHAKSSIPWFNGKTFLPEPLARHIAGLAPLLSTPIDASGRAVSLHQYHGGVYKRGGEEYSRRQIAELLGGGFNDSRAEATVLVLREITKISDEKLNKNSSSLINVKNGMLDWRNFKLLPHSPEYASTIQIPVDWDPSAPPAAISAFIEQVVPPDAITMLLESFGYSLIPDTSLQSSWALIGKGENGKSTLLNLWTALVGPENVSHISLQDLEENPFRAANLMDKLLNIFFDLDSRALKSTSMFKALVAGDPITAEHKYSHPFSFKNFARLAFSANEFPRSSDRSHAFFRRLKVIPFPNSFPPDRRDPNLLAKITTPAELSGLLFLAVSALNQVMARGAFNPTPSSDAALNEYRRRCDTSFSYISEFLQKDPKQFLSKTDVYSSYCSWTEANGLFKASATEFNARIMDHFDGIRIVRKTDSSGVTFKAWDGIHKILEV